MKTLNYLPGTLKGRCKPQTFLELFLHTPQTCSYIQIFISSFYFIIDVVPYFDQHIYTICKLHKPTMYERLPFSTLSYPLIAHGLCYIIA